MNWNLITPKYVFSLAIKYDPVEIYYFYFELISQIGLVQSKNKFMITNIFGYFISIEKYKSISLEVEIKDNLYAI